MIKKAFKRTYTNEEATQRIAVWLSFLLPVVIMMSIFIIKGIYPFGDRSFLFSDMYHQYLPFLTEFVRKIKDGQGLYYSYNVGMGSNFLALYVYYLASPFNWLAFLVPEKFLIEFMSYLVIFRLGLCGLTSYIYLQRHFEEKSPAALFFSCFYALSGFTAAYNWDVMWLDCVMLLPIILLGLERLVKEGKCGLYCVALAFSILTNYYISIMICIYLVLYFVVLLITEKRSFKIIFNFALYSLLAAGISAVLLIPEVCAILATDFGDMDFPRTLTVYFSVLDELARHCLCVTTERGLEHWPNIYCGSAVFFMIPMYVSHQGISIKKRFCNLALAGIFLLSFAMNIPDFIWHGLNYPDSLPARQSFIYILLVIVMCYEVYLKLDQISERHILFGYLGAVIFLLFSEKFVESDDFDTGIELLTLLFVTIFAVLLYLRRTKDNPRVRQILAMITLVAVIAETSINTFNTSVGTVSRSEYLEDLTDYAALNEYVKENSGLPIYRIEKFTRKTKNDGTLAGFPTASVFSSTMNSYVMDLYTRFGMRHSKVFYGFDGATAFTAALLNVGWMFGKDTDYANSVYSLEEMSGDISLYSMAYSLPFGYVAPYEYDLPESVNGIRLQNEMAKELGIKDKLFENAEKNVSGDNVRITAKKDGVYYAAITAAGTKKVDLIGGSLGEISYGDLKNGSIIYLGYLYEGESVTIVNGDDDDETPKVMADGYVLNEDVLEQIIEILGSRSLEDVTADSTHISGKLNLDDAGRLILSIPYEKGWTITVNGVEKEPQMFGESLIALDLEAGEYDIALAYVPQGRNAGLTVSILSIILFIVLTIKNKNNIFIKRK